MQPNLIASSLWIAFIVIFCLENCNTLQISSNPSLSRRNIFEQCFLSATVPFVTGARIAWAAGGDFDDAFQTVRVEISNSSDSIGVQIYNTEIRGRPVVAIQRVILPKNPRLEEGMVLKGYSSAQALTEKLRSGPFPIELEFLNLAAGGDAISDFGTSIVTPKDALVLAQQIDPPANSKVEYSISTLQSPPRQCMVRSRRGDVLELNYEATYEAVDGRRVPYDSSSFRGTGLPYQMVLGSGDMIPGVDQGLYDMCPGEVRYLRVPPQLAYGNRARESFRVPKDYVALEWRVELISIDGIIRKNNNDKSREEREGRSSY